MSGSELSGQLATPWAIAYADMENLPKDPENPAFDDAREGFVEIGPKGDRLIGQVELGMHSEESAINLEKVAIGLLAFVKMAPEEAPFDGLLVDNVDIGRDGKELAVVVDAPLNETVSALLKHAQE